MLKISRIKCQSGILCVCFFFLQQGHRLDSLNDAYWLMTFFESACFIASQMFANWLIGNNTEKITAPSSAVIFFAAICFTFITRGWTENPGSASLKEYSRSLYAYILGGKFTSFSYSSVLFIILWSTNFLLPFFNKKTTTQCY